MGILKRYAVALLLLILVVAGCDNGNADRIKVLEAKLKSTIDLQVKHMKLCQNDCDTLVEVVKSVRSDANSTANFLQEVAKLDLAYRENVEARIGKLELVLMDRD